MTQLDSIKETLGEHEFEVFKLDPLKSLAALNVVKETLAPALGSLLGALDSVADVTTLLDDPDGGGKLGGSIERLLLEATNERQRELIDAFMPVSHVDGKPLKGQFDLVFRGDLPLMFSWLRLAFRGEWGNVLGAIKTGMSGAIARVNSPQKSPPT